MKEKPKLQKQKNCDLEVSHTERQGDKFVSSARNRKTDDPRPRGLHIHQEKEAGTRSSGSR